MLNCTAPLVRKCVVLEESSAFSHEVAKQSTKKSSEHFDASSCSLGVSKGASEPPRAFCGHCASSTGEVLVSGKDVVFLFSVGPASLTKIDKVGRGCSLPPQNRFRQIVT